MNDRLVARIPRAPAEGWLSLVLVFVLSVCLAWSFDSARWVLGRPALTSFLPYATAGGVAWGFISAKVGWSRWLAHLLGAVFAALLLPIAVGGVLLNGDFTPGPAFFVTASSSVDAYLDLAFRGLAFTQQYAHFMLVLGILCWGTGQFTSYAVFGHHRPLNAVIISGLALVLDMSITRDEQLGILIWFSLAALFLLIRLHALDERSTWLRHRLGDAGSLSGIYLRAGSVFVTVAVLGALVLTSTASSAPLAGLGRGLDQRLVELTHGLEAVFRGGGAGTRLAPVDFLTSTPITGQWITDSTPVLQITVPDAGQYHWRAVAYDFFDGRNWSITHPDDTSVAAGGPLLAGTLDDPGSAAGRHPVTISVHELNFDPPNVFAPDAPVKTSTDATVSLLGSAPDAFIGSITKSTSADYSVTAQVPIDYATDPAHGLTGNQLSVAGTDYPAAVTKYYLQLDPTVQRRPEHESPAGGDPGRPPDCKRPVQPEPGDRGLPQVRGRLHLPGERLGRRLRQRRRRRVLRHEQGRLLRVLRQHDGRPPPDAGHPGPDGRGLPAQHARRQWRRGHPAQRRPCLGRGLLPRLRLDHVRPDRGRNRRGRRAAGRSAGHASPNDQRRAAEQRRHATPAADDPRPE